MSGFKLTSYIVLNFSLILTYARYRLTSFVNTTNM